MRGQTYFDWGRKNDPDSVCVGPIFSLEGHLGDFLARATAKAEEAFDALKDRVPIPPGSREHEGPFRVRLEDLPSSRPRADRDKTPLLRDAKL